MLLIKSIALAIITIVLLVALLYIVVVVSSFLYVLVTTIYLGYKNRGNNVQ